MTGRIKPRVRVIPDQSAQDYVSTRRKQGETLTDAMRRVTEEAREEISRTIEREADKAPTN